MTTPEQAIATARALLRSRRANLCRHGVAHDHCAMCELPADDLLPEQRDPRAEEARAEIEETAHG